MEPKNLSRLTRVLLYAVCALVALLIGGLYVSADLRQAFLLAYGMSDPGRSWAVMTFLTAMGAMALWILAELIGVLRSVDTEPVLRSVDTEPFVERNVRAFFRMGLAAELAGVAFFIKSGFLFTFMTAVCGLVMVLSGLFALVLAQVFRRAVEYKQENDLTI